jgi:hypothetical protein
MKYAFDSRLGEQLYGLLPELYRTRDGSVEAVGDADRGGDLARYLDSHGVLLDLIHATLEQQQRDLFPDTCQDWLLPYFAELLAATMLSPHAEGRHREISNAVPWRQRKGTLRCAEEIAEAVGGAEAEIQEGWRRVALTPRIGMPLLDRSVIDSELQDNPASLGFANRHPDLPVATVDLRAHSRAVAAEADNPAARRSLFAGVPRTWRQLNRLAAPCFQDSFEDASRRTVDFRTGGPRPGRYHHRRLLAYLPPPPGLFPMPPLSVKWSELDNPRHAHLIEQVEENGAWVIRNLTRRRLEVTERAELSEARAYRVESLCFIDELTVQAGGTLDLYRVEATRVEVLTASTEQPVFNAVDCLFDELSVGAGFAVMDSCTVLGTAYLHSIDALDCLFSVISGTGVTGVVQHCRVPEDAPFAATGVTLEELHFESPAYFSSQISLAARAVLAPGTGDAITAGARDGGELGYYHRGRPYGAVRILGPFAGAQALVIPAPDGFTLRELTFEEPVEVSGGLLALQRCAARQLTVTTTLTSPDLAAVPVLDARECVFTELEIPHRQARLEYCTVMESISSKHLQASDCVFAGVIEGVQQTPPANGQASFENCLRFSALPAGLLTGIEALPESDARKRLARALGLLDRLGAYRPGSNTLDRPLFLTLDYCLPGGHQRRTPEFGEPGYGVLSPYSSEAIRFGAEDGGEMGAMHGEFYSLKSEAVLDKLTEFLPVGIEPTLIFDSRLWRPPPGIAE